MSLGGHGGQHHPDVGVGERVPDSASAAEQLVPGRVVRVLAEHLDGPGEAVVGDHRGHIREHGAVGRLRDHAGRVAVFAQGVEGVGDRLRGLERGVLVRAKAAFSSSRPPGPPPPAPGPSRSLSLMPPSICRPPSRATLVCGSGGVIIAERGGLPGPGGQTSGDRGSGGQIRGVGQGAAQIRPPRGPDRTAVGLPRHARDRVPGLDDRPMSGRPPAPDGAEGHPVGRRVAWDRSSRSWSTSDRTVSWPGGTPAASASVPTAAARTGALGGPPARGWWMGSCSRWARPCSPSVPSRATPGRWESGPTRSPSSSVALLHHGGVPAVPRVGGRRSGRWNRRPGGRGWHRRAHGRSRFFVFRPRQIDWWASGIQLVGTLYFNVSTGNAVRIDLSAQAAQQHVWRPDALGLGLLPRGQRDGVIRGVPRVDGVVTRRHLVVDHRPQPGGVHRLRGLRGGRLHRAVDRTDLARGAVQPRDLRRCPLLPGRSGAAVAGTDRRTRAARPSRRLTGLNPGRAADLRSGRGCTVRAAYTPHIPCTPAPGGVEAEHR